MSNDNENTDGNVPAGDKQLPDSLPDGGPSGTSQESKEDDPTFEKPRQYSRGERVSRSSFNGSTGHWALSRGRYGGTI